MVSTVNNKQVSLAFFYRVFRRLQKG